MAGLRKAKKYDWKDSNMALFGSDTERQVKKESALTEPAWEGAGVEVGLRIWRIVKFQVTDWPKEEYGDFYSGDSYIILNTYKKNENSEDLNYDLHFWIGKYSTQDEYGTAAYKTVELDTYLDDKAVQRREVQHHESELFKSYFSVIQYNEGGAETGFRHVEPKEYIPRLLCFMKETKKVVVKQVPFAKSSIVPGDVYVLDNGLDIIQWNSDACSGSEKYKAQEYCQKLESDRGNAKARTIDESESGGSKDRVFDALPDTPEGDDDEDDEPIVDTGKRVLLRISDAGGSIAMDKVKEGGITRGDLGSDDVYLVDSGLQVFVFVGSNCSETEKKNGLPYATNYIMENGLPAYLPILVLNERSGTSELDSVLEG